MSRRLQLTPAPAISEGSLAERQILTTGLQAPTKSPEPNSCPFGTPLGDTKHVEFKVLGEGGLEPRRADIYKILRNGV